MTAMSIEGGAPCARRATARPRAIARPGPHYTAALRTAGGIRFVRRHEPIDQGPLEEGRPPAEWRRLFYRLSGVGRPGGHDIVCHALGLSTLHPADEAPRLALNYFGVTAAKIVREKSQWNFPLAPEKGEDAVIVPVGGTIEPVCLSLLGFHEAHAKAEMSEIADLIAIPLDGSPALSFTAASQNIGAFAVSGGTLRLATSGLGWLRRHVARARKMAEEMPSHLIADRLPFPDRMETLLLDPAAFEWRMSRPDCAIPESVKRVVCDTPKLAQFIAGETKKRERGRATPSILGPKDDQS